MLCCVVAAEKCLLASLFNKVPRLLCRCGMRDARRGDGDFGTVIKEFGEGSITLVSNTGGGEIFRNPRKPGGDQESKSRERKAVNSMNNATTQGQANERTETHEHTQQEGMTFTKGERTRPVNEPTYQRTSIHGSMLEGVQASDGRTLDGAGMEWGHNRRALRLGRLGR